MSVFTAEVQADQGNPQSIGSAWPTKPTDGTNTQAFLATGEAKVSVTQPLPAGSNNIGSVTTTPTVSSTSTVTRVATSTTSATLLAANTSRKGALIFTETGTTFVLFGTGTASATNYTVSLTINSFFSIPTAWQGAIQAVRSSGTGNVQVTELT